MKTFSQFEFEKAVVMDLTTLLRKGPRGRRAANIVVGRYRKSLVKHEGYDAATADAIVRNCLDVATLEVEAV